LLAAKGYDVKMLPATKGGNGYGIKSESNEKWNPKIGQHDKCILGLCCLPDGVLVIHTVWRLPVKRLARAQKVKKIESMDPQAGIWHT
jgi:hypothetical protein